MIDNLVDLLHGYNRIKYTFKNEETKEKLAKIYEEAIKDWFKRLPEYRTELSQRIKYAKGEWRDLLEKDIQTCEHIMAIRNAKMYQDSS